MTHPTMAQAEDAGRLLGVSVFFLGNALREQAVAQFKMEVDRIRGYERPNFGQAHQLLAAAEACDQAWAEVTKASADEEVSA